MKEEFWDFEFCTYKVICSY